jgi:hypothetical protein
MVMLICKGRAWLLNQPCILLFSVSLATTWMYLWPIGIVGIDIGDHVLNLREREEESQSFMAILQGKHVEMASNIVSFQCLVEYIVTHLNLPLAFMVSPQPSQ